MEKILHLLSTLKAAPSEHPEPGWWGRCAKAQEENTCCSSCTSARDNCRLERRPNRILGCPAPIREPVAPAALTGTLLGRHSPARLCRTEPVLSRGPNWFENLAGKAAWVRKSLCQGNLPAPGPALPWSRGDSCRGVSPQAGGHQPPAPTHPHPQQRFFLSPGICN